MNADDIIKIINELCSKLGIAVDWSAENITPYLQQAATQLATAKCNVHHGIFVGAAVLFIIGLLCFVPEIVRVYIKKAGHDPYFDWENGPGFGVFLIAVSIVAGIISYILWIQWRDTPTLMAIKWFMAALKGN